PVRRRALVVPGSHRLVAECDRLAAAVRWNCVARVRGGGPRELAWQMACAGRTVDRGNLLQLVPEPQARLPCGERYLDSRADGKSSACIYDLRGSGAGIRGAAALRG